MTGSKRIIRNDWNKYNIIFPLRYLEGDRTGQLLSFSDKAMKDALFQRPPGKALDVGGGVSGTSYLIEWADDYMLLEQPEVKSDLIRITWRDIYLLPNDHEFDVALARGSINYLNIGAIISIIDVIKGGGLFIFNTFINPPSDKMERRYESATGTGIECAKLVSGKPFGTVLHELIPDGEDYCITHSFNYYPISFLREILEPFFNCRVVKNSNSAVFICEKL